MRLSESVWSLVLVGGLMLNFELVQSSLVVAPRNTVVVAGQRMEMECKTNRETKVHDWTFQRSSTSEKLKIFSNYETEPNRIDPSFEHFGADVDANGSGFIYSNKTRLEDAGIYTCRIQEGQRQPVPYSAQLIVLDKEPFCETNQLSDRNLMDKIWFKCSVNFTGNWAPIMEWRQHCRDTTTVLTDGFVTITTNSSVTSTLTLTVHSSDSLCNVSCKTYFSSNTSITNDVATANNIPDYSYTWDFSENQVSTGRHVSSVHRVTTREVILMSDILTSSSERIHTSGSQPINLSERTNGSLVYVGVSVAAVMIIIIISIFLYQKYRRGGFEESVDLQEVGKKSQEKDFAMEIHPSDELSPSDNMNVAQNDYEHLATVLVYLMTAMWTWLALASTMRANLSTSISIDEETAEGSYATLTREVPPSVNLRQRVSIDEYAEVPICDDFAIYSDVRSNVSQIESPSWTPRYCGFISAEPSPPTFFTGIEDCEEPIDPCYEILVPSRSPKMPHHHRSRRVHFSSSNDVHTDDALRMRQRNELEDFVTRDGSYEENDYLHFHNDAMATKLSTEERSDVFCEKSPFEMDSSYLTCRTTDDVDSSYLRTDDRMDSSYLRPADFMDSSYLRTAARMDSSYIEMTDCMDLSASQRQEIRKPAAKGYVTSTVTPKIETASDPGPSGSRDFGSNPVEGETARKKIEHPKPPSHGQGTNL